MPIAAHIHDKRPKDRHLRGDTDGVTAWFCLAASAPTTGNREHRELNSRNASEQRIRGQLTK
jgi:hypothetical protein